MTSSYLNQLAVFFFSRILTNVENFDFSFSSNGEMYHTSTNLLNHNYLFGVFNYEIEKEETKITIPLSLKSIILIELRKDYPSYFFSIPLFECDLPYTGNIKYLSKLYAGGKRIFRNTEYYINNGFIIDSDHNILFGWYGNYDITKREYLVSNEVKAIKKILKVSPKVLKKEDPLSKLFMTILPHIKEVNSYWNNIEIDLTNISIEITEDFSFYDNKIYKMNNYSFDKFNEAANKELRRAIINPDFLLND